MAGWIALLFMAGMTRQATAPAKPPLAPSTSWTIDYADAQCILSRTFGTGKDSVILGIAMLPGTRSDEVLLIERGMPLNTARQPRVRVTMLPGGETAQDEADTAPMKDGGRITRIALKNAEIAPLVRSNRVDIQLEGRTISLNMAGIKAALSAAETCKADLLREWKLDPQIVTRAVQPPEPAAPPQSWVSDSDYPDKPLSKQERGRSIFRLDIDSSGKVTACTVIQTSSSAALDTETCRIMQGRARFKPARDADGNAVPSIWVDRFWWIS